MLRQNAWNTYNEADLSAVESLSADYKDYLMNAKTEREAVAYMKKHAAQAGFIPLEEVVEKKQKLKAGDRVIMTHMGKTAALFVIGEEPLEKGIHIVGSHIDSPRLDLKQNPLYEDGELAYLDTHYYGGIKKYQWVVLPLAIHGVVVKKNGEVIIVTIGEDKDDPVLGITDLLPHIAQHQMQKKASVVIEGEDLNLLVGSKPLKDTEKDAVKAQILQILDEKYNIEEEDFVSAELEIVPAGEPRDYGLDRSMIMGYGHDDSSCAYPAFRAILEQKTPKYTCVALFTDKEEIGSVGATGSQSMVFENAIAELVAATGEYSELKVRRALQNSCVLSSDVTSAYDSIYAGEFDLRNAAKMGYGLTINKYTGVRGKSGANDANAEYLARLRKIFDENKVVFQTSEIGKVDHGGGGTIAFIIAKYGGEVVDCGVPVLSMHAPWEIISKADLYESFKGYDAFMRAE